MGRFDANRGRGGRGRGRGRPNDNGQTERADKSNEERKTLQDYELQLNKSGDYEKIKEYILNHIRQKYSHDYDIGLGAAQLPPLTRN